MQKMKRARVEGFIHTTTSSVDISDLGCHMTLNLIRSSMQRSHVSFLARLFGHVADANLSGDRY